MFSMTRVLMVLGIGLFSITGVASLPQATDAGTYSIDPSHSKVGFEVSHLVISSVEGVFKGFSGTVDLNTDFTKTKVSASIDVDSIDTGVAKRDGHLKSPDFFDAKKFPKMSFVSQSIKGTPEAFVAEGDLTLRGVTKRVQLKGRFLGAVTDGFGQRKVAFQASTEINRKDFGLSWNNMVEAGPVVGDSVRIDLKIQAGRPAAKK